MTKNIKRIIRHMVFILLLGFAIMWLVYSGYYSQGMLKILNVMNPIKINPVAAKSQQQGGLNQDLHGNLEPGSPLWVARQAYLDLMWENIQQGQSHELSRIYAAYQALNERIKQLQKKKKNSVQNKSNTQTKPVLTHPFNVDASVINDYSMLLNPDEQKSNAELKQRYLLFIQNYLNEHPQERYTDDQIFQDIAYLYYQHGQRPPLSLSKPYAIVVVGGGLTRDKTTKAIIVNRYTEERLKTTLEVMKEYPLPIVLSGVEAPYMQKWLKNHGVSTNLLERKSMNTCENARFTSLLLQKQGGAPTVILITDAYHMPRTRRLFAQDGVDTIAKIAPMPVSLTDSAWQTSLSNYDHSRRANYEFLATLRDRLFGVSDCREIPQ